MPRKNNVWTSGEILAVQSEPIPRSVQNAPTLRSGAVSLLRMRAIRELRCSLVKQSTAVLTLTPQKSSISLSAELLSKVVFDD